MTVQEHPMLKEITENDLTVAPFKFESSLVYGGYSGTRGFSNRFTNKDAVVLYLLTEQATQNHLKELFEKYGEHKIEIVGSTQDENGYWVDTFKVDGELLSTRETPIFDFEQIIPKLWLKRTFDGEPELLDFLNAFLKDAYGKNSFVDLAKNIDKHFTPYEMLNLNMVHHEADNGTNFVMFLEKGKKLIRLKSNAFDILPYSNQTIPTIVQFYDWYTAQK